MLVAPKFATPLNQLVFFKKNPDAQEGLKSIKSECVWWKPGISIFKDPQVIPKFGSHCLLDGI